MKTKARSISPFAARAALKTLIYGSELVKEQTFRENLGLLVGCVYAAPPLYLVIAAAGKLLGPDAPMPWWPLAWRTAIAVALIWNATEAYSAQRGLWYPLSLWESSIRRRERRKRAHARPDLQDLMTMVLQNCKCIFAILQ